IQFHDEKEATYVYCAVVLSNAPTSLRKCVLSNRGCLGVSLEKLETSNNIEELWMNDCTIADVLRLLKYSTNLNKLTIGFRPDDVITPSTNTYIPSPKLTYLKMNIRRDIHFGQVESLLKLCGINLKEFYFHADDLLRNDFTYTDVVA
ncbi:unnamed protein product, partial [Didymodactylos carnosus]